jgi:hypothetical protein
MPLAHFRPQQPKESPRGDDPEQTPPLGQRQAIILILLLALALWGVGWGLVLAAEYVLRQL